MQSRGGVSILLLFLDQTPASPTTCSVSTTVLLTVSLQQATNYRNPTAKWLTTTDSFSWIEQQTKNVFEMGRFPLNWQNQYRQQCQCCDYGNLNERYRFIRQCCCEAVLINRHWWHYPATDWYSNNQVFINSIQHSQFITHSGNFFWEVQ